MLLASPHWASGQAVASSAKAMASGGKEEGKGTSLPPLSASVKSVSFADWPLLVPQKRSTAREESRAEQPQVDGKRGPRAIGKKHG